jgi:antitoxin component of RelBE/YafQ-DinJ toxin-antitoxin module
MKKELIVDVENDLLQDATQVLGRVGIDMQTAVKIFLMRLVKEQNLSFLLTNSHQYQAIAGGPKNTTQTIQPKIETIEKGNMTKAKAISLLRSNGVSFTGSVTFASKNRTVNNYWANPDFDVLETDWYLILNDWIKEELHLFLIPANSIQKHELIARNDLKNKVDLQIMYDDTTFTDIRSELSFKKYFVKKLSY